MAARFTGVCVGPGDPELVTIGALRVLRAADRVFAPTMAAAEEGRAESIIGAAAPDVVVERLVFSINSGRAAQIEAHHAAVARILDHLDAGEQTAFVTLGDPNVYSTFHHLACLVGEARPGVDVATVPGIMAFQDLASRTGTVVVDGTQRLVVLSALDGPEVVDDPLADGGTAIVIYKGGRHLAAITDRLRSAGRLDGAVFGELLGLGGERIGPLAELGDGPSSYLASIIVPPVPAS